MAGSREGGYRPPEKEVNVGGKSSKDDQGPKLVPLDQRLSQRDPHLRFRIVKDNPGPGELTQKELASFDTESGPEEGDMASAALLIAMVDNGTLNRKQFIEQLAEQEIYEGDKEGEEPRRVLEEARLQRANTTLDRMLQAGLLVEGEVGPKGKQVKKIYCNTEISQR